MDTPEKIIEELLNRIKGLKHQNQSLQEACLIGRNTYKQLTEARVRIRELEEGLKSLHFKIVHLPSLSRYEFADELGKMREHISKVLDKALSNK